MKFEKPEPLVPIFSVGDRTRFLNVPHALDLANELVVEDCYYLDQMPEGATVFDVGACYGMFGLIMACEKKCKVTMYEPAFNNWTIAGLNHRLNETIFDLDDVWIFRAAIGGEDRMRKDFSYHPGHPAGSGFLIDTPTKEEVQVLKLSEQIMLRRGSGPVVVKLDCEGSEKEIFEQDFEFVVQADIITMEWHYHAGPYCRDILLANGFEVEITGCGLPRPAWDESVERGLLFAKRKSSLL